MYLLVQIYEGSLLVFYNQGTKKVLAIDTTWCVVGSVFDPHSLSSESIRYLRCEVHSASLSYRDRSHC